jgi:hypothetical protein
LSDSPNADAPQERISSHREIVVGRNSAVWTALAEDEGFSRRFHSLGHKDVADYSFRTDDRVWILSYSRNSRENQELLDLLRRSGVRNAIYVSTATTNVVARTQCYEYPSTKLEAERCARSLVGAKILTIGLVFKSEAELPAGIVMATHLESLRQFMRQPIFEKDQTVRLFKPVQRPFSGTLERQVYGIYGLAIRICGRWPCLLRPVDLVLRALGWRWYGYLFLSNKLWSTTTS